MLSIRIIEEPSEDSDKGGTIETVAVWAIYLILLALLFGVPYCARRLQERAPKPVPYDEMETHHLVVQGKRLTLQAVVKPCYSPEL